MDRAKRGGFKGGLCLDGFRKVIFSPKFCHTYYEDFKSAIQQENDFA